MNPTALNPSAEKFGVICEGHNLSDAVDFTCSHDGLIVVVQAGRRIEATVSLNSQAECVIVVDRKELSNWEFRRLVLEPFFRF